MKHELEILQSISHPNIIQIFELLHDNTNYYIVSEWMKGGELFDFANTRKKKSNPLTEGEVIVVAK